MRGKVLQLVNQSFTEVARRLDGVIGTGEEVVVDLNGPGVDGIDGGLSLFDGWGNTLLIRFVYCSLTASTHSIVDTLGLLDDNEVLSRCLEGV